MPNRNDYEQQAVSDTRVNETSYGHTALNTRPPDEFVTATSVDPWSQYVTTRGQYGEVIDPRNTPTPVTPRMFNKGDPVFHKSNANIKWIVADVVESNGLSQDREYVLTTIGNIESEYPMKTIYVREHEIQLVVPTTTTTITMTTAGERLQGSNQLGTMVYY